MSLSQRPAHLIQEDVHTNSSTLAVCERFWLDDSFKGKENHFSPLPPRTLPPLRWYSPLLGQLPGKSDCNLYVKDDDDDHSNIVKDNKYRHKKS